jgi:hypothetical protein
MLLQTILVSTLPLLALARTDLTGCTSSVSGPSLVWYVPDTGELCDFLDCGGGRAPPKTTVPGCAAYSGTATYSASYLPGWGPDGKSSATVTAKPSGYTITIGPSDSLVTETTFGVPVNSTALHTGAVTTKASNATVSSKSSPSASVQSTNGGSSVVASIAIIGGSLLGLAVLL